MVDLPDGHARSRSHDFLRPVTCIKVFKARPTLAEDLRAEDMLCYLIQDGILGEEEEETILYEKTTKARANKLLDVILLKGDPACRVFGNALCRTSPHLIMALNDVTVTGSDKQAYERWRMAQTIDEVDGQPKVSRNMCEYVLWYTYVALSYVTLVSVSVLLFLCQWVHLDLYT